MSTSPTGPEKAARIRNQPDPLARILAMARTLQGPDGCPWDAKQTVESLTPYLQEETYEVVEAVAGRDRAGFREELGDLLFLVSLFAVVGEQSGWGSLDEIAEAVVDKLVRRHPHVFAEGDALEPEGALRQWEELKRAEQSTAEGDAPTALGNRPPGLPALTTAFRISEKAGAVGFEWPTTGEALAKVAEELEEVRQDLERDAPAEELEREVGDLLYSVANLARYLRIDPERALRGTIAKFMRRFRYVEAELHREGRTPETSTLAEMDRLWNRAKTEEASGD